MPMIDVQRRFRELGRIRLGQKTEKGHPRALSEFRLTSASREVLERAAECYGGNVVKWEQQFALNTGVSALDVRVPPGEPISQHWEMWGPKQGVGVVCLRRCNGRALATGEPCLCPEDLWDRADQAKAGKACKPTTRLSVLLPRLPDIGIWRMDTHGIIAAMELPGTVDLIVALAQGAGVNMPATLRIEQRTIIREDRKTTVNVPVLAINESLLEMEARLALPAPYVPKTLGERSNPPLPGEPARELPRGGTSEVSPAVSEGEEATEYPRSIGGASSAVNRPQDPDAWKAAARERKITQADLLKKARDLADVLGVRPPLALAGITDGELCDQLWTWLESTGRTTTTAG